MATVLKKVTAQTITKLGTKKEVKKASKPGSIEAVKKAMDIAKKHPHFFN